MRVVVDPMTRDRLGEHRFEVTSTETRCLECGRVVSRWVCGQPVCDGDHREEEEDG